MTKQQALWAAEHDWFRGAGVENGQYHVFAVDTSTADNTVVKFSRYNLLTAWAGY